MWRYEAQIFLFFNKIWCNLAYPGARLRHNLILEATLFCHIAPKFVTFFYGATIRHMAEGSHVVPPKITNECVP